MLSLASTNGGTSDSVGRGIVKNMVDIRMEQLVGKDISNPMPTRSVGGWAMMFLLFTLSSVANVLIDERRNAVFVRHLAAPFSRGQILLSRYIYSTILGIIQLVVLFLAGTLLFGIDIFSNAGNLLLVIVFAAAAATGFGMLIASIARTAAQASALGLVLILSMSAIGGAWFPTTFMPATIQALSKLTIVYWSMEAFMVVLWRHGGILDVAPYLGVLAGIAAVVTALSVWRFSKGQVLL
jgi:ABC-2 type transport system permease protein